MMDRRLRENIAPAGSVGHDAARHMELQRKGVTARPSRAWSLIAFLGLGLCAVACNPDSAVPVVINLSAPTGAPSSGSPTTQEDANSGASTGTTSSSSEASTPISGPVGGSGSSGNASSGAADATTDLDGAMPTDDGSSSADDGGGSLPESGASSPDGGANACTKKLCIFDCALQGCSKGCGLNSYCM